MRPGSALILARTFPLISSVHHFNTGAFTLKSTLTRAIFGVALSFLFSTLPAHAGMTVYGLTDVARMRLQDISFFGFLLMLSAVGVRFLWNIVARDFPRMPRLTLLKAAGVTGLLSLFMLLILVMISGARELLTPGAWNRQGSHYRPNDIGSRELRYQSAESLRAALRQYAHAHEGHFPAHDYVPEIAPKIWQAPDSTGTRYVYVAGLSQKESSKVVAFEPSNFGEERFVLFADGQLRALKTAEIHRLLGAENVR